jgi:hypothetical protein
MLHLLMFVYIFYICLHRVYLKGLNLISLNAMKTFRCDWKCFKWQIDRDLISLRYCAVIAYLTRVWLHLRKTHCGTYQLFTYFYVYTIFTNMIHVHIYSTGVRLKNVLLKSAFFCMIIHVNIFATVFLQVIHNCSWPKTYMFILIMPSSIWMVYQCLEQGSIGVVLIRDRLLNYTSIIISMGTFLHLDFKRWQNHFYNVTPINCLCLGLCNVCLILVMLWCLLFIYIYICNVYLVSCLFVYI